MATENPAGSSTTAIPRPESGDVVELILEDHRLIEHLLRELRNEQNDREALRRQISELLGATELYDEEFSHHLHEFSETLLPHLDEEERDILNPAREDVSEQDRAELGVAWLAERNRMLDEGCGSLEQVGALVDGS